MRSFLAALLLVASQAQAQTPIVPGISGQVIDSASRLGIGGAEVTLGGQRAITNQLGEFRLSLAGAGSDTLRVRRLGFQSRLVPVPDHGSTAPLRVALSAIPQQLSRVVVEARFEGYPARLRGYYERLARGTTGQFITREDLDQERTGLLTNVLQRAPGVQVRRGRGAPQLSMRGRDCRPLVWLDAVALQAGDVDLDAFDPSSLHGVELYLGATNAPLRFQGSTGKSECGTIMLWSRGPDTDPVESHDDMPPGELERLIALRHVFPADAVDQVATAAPQALRVAYPPHLRALKLRGTVVAEYIVDTLGQVEPGSFSTVTASDPRFVPVVWQALQHARYAPARRGGVAVRQLVRQRFNFDVSADRDG